MTTDISTLERLNLKAVSDAYSPRLKRWHSFEVKATVRGACIANLPVFVALQDRLYPGVMTGGAKIVRRAIGGRRAIDVASNRCFPKFVTFEFVFAIFQLKQFVAKVADVFSEFDVSLSCGCKLFLQAGDSLLCLFLRKWRGRFHKSFKFAEGIYCRIQRRSPVRGDLHSLLGGIQVEVHEGPIFLEELEEPVRAGGETWPTRPVSEFGI